MEPPASDLGYLVDLEHWGCQINPEDESHHTEKIINGYIACTVRQYQIKGYEGNQLWEIFHEDFEGFSLELWQQGARKALRDLRDELVVRGVCVPTPKKAGSYAKALFYYQQQEEPEEGSEEQIKERQDKQKQLRRNAPIVLTPQTDATASGSNPSVIRTSQVTPSSPATLRRDQPEDGRTYISGPIPSPYGPQTGNTQYRGDPTCQNDPVGYPTKQLTEIMKIYSTNDNKYGGEEYDILDVKLRHFYDCCGKLGLSREYYALAFSVILKDGAKQYYYNTIAGNAYDFDTMVQMMKTHFETEERRQKYLSDWRETTLLRAVTENPTKSRLECFQVVATKLQMIQQALTPEYRTDLVLRDQIINACRGVDECSLALYKPATSFEAVCAELRSAIGTATRARADNSAVYTSQVEELPDDSYGQYWTDRTYGGSGRTRGNSRSGPNGRKLQLEYGRKPDQGYQRNQGFQQNRQFQKKCYVCNKPGCWSTKHTIEERRRAYDRFRQQESFTTQKDANPETYGSFLAQYEGLEALDDNTDENQEYGQFTITADLDCGLETNFTELGQINGTEAVTILNDYSAYHALTHDDNSQPQEKPTENAVFTLDRYTSEEFHGIMPDSGAAGISSAGEQQVLALQRQMPGIQIDSSTAGNNTIKFGKGTATVKGTIRVPTPLGIISFHVVPTNTPFLMCLQDMDAMGVRFDNLRNLLVQGTKLVPIIRKWGHPWMLLKQTTEALACHLTESELRRVHRRFGHPSVQRLYNILQRAGHDVNADAIRQLTKYCHQCQMNEKSPGRFKFTLKDDYEFNYSIVVDVFYLDQKPVLQVIDSATAFGAARFLKDMSARTAWDTLRACWIDTYLGPPDKIVTDAGKNFASAEFRQLAKSMSVNVEEVPVEAHNSIGLVERYHAPLKRAYKILQDELKGENVDKESILQMAVKAVNDSAGPDGIVPTLLVFGAYPRMTDTDVPSVSVAKRAEAIRAATKDVRRLLATRQVRDALATRNGPNTEPTLSLPLQSDVRVWREKDGWQGPYKLIALSGETCTIGMPYGPTNFRSTVVKPYFQDPERLVNRPQDSLQEDDNTGESGDEYRPADEPPPPVKRGRGRPKGSKNKKTAHEPRHVGTHQLECHITRKEQADQDLSLKLRKDGTITTPGKPFEQSQQQEIDGLLARGVFEFVQYNPEDHAGIRIFNSRLVNEVKGKATSTPFEKSRLVIQAYNDVGKEVILTQSPTIQRASQRLIIALAPSLQQQGIKLYLRDITQAYIQSTTMLNRLILARLPPEMRTQFPNGTIMVVRKPLYGIPEAGTHWWATYYRHHKDKLSMVTSTYDPCLLVSTGKAFGIVGMQTDDTLILGSTEFADREDRELQEAKLTAKPREQLSVQTDLDFNGCILKQEDDGSMLLLQKGQGKKISPVTGNDQYREQRARGAYVASICQPEAAFDLSIAAQHQNPTEEDVRALNKRLTWQMEHQDRGIRYVPLDLSTVKLFVFVDGSFANNKDYSSQIGYTIILANESDELSTDRQEFEIKGNLIHWSSTKSKRVTRSVLASEIYGMVGGVDIAIAINTTIKIVTEQLNLPPIPIVIGTDSYSLYECLVKLGTTKEKRLMIDIMALRQSYERREIAEVRWIDGKDNPADAMTKSASNKALERFLDSNTLRIKVDGWVERET